MLPKLHPVYKTYIELQRSVARLEAYSDKSEELQQAIAKLSEVRDFLKTYREV